MKIINACFAKGLGGIEQSFVDYMKCLMKQGHEVHMIVHPKAELLDHLGDFKDKVTIHPMQNYGLWDYFAVHRLRRLLKRIAPDVIIAHGGRASHLLRKASAGQVPIIGVTHNYSFRHNLKLDALIATTKDLHQALLGRNYPEDQIYDMPNMIDLDNAPEAALKKRKVSNPPVIGTMGRFVKKKGFDVLLKALAILKQKNIAFKAVIGGAGEEEEALKMLASRLDLSADVNFTGWVEDKNAFFEQMDVFCLPSLHEPFGIILLEAFLAGKPVVSTPSEGPIEIIENSVDALLAKSFDPEDLAAQLETMLNDQKAWKKYTEKALSKVKQKYALDKVASRLDEILKAVVL